MARRARLRVPGLPSLQAFVAAARHGSFTLAGEELCLTQSAVSRQVQALEALLGTALFSRDRNRIALTGAGEAYLARIKGPLDELESSTVDFMAHKGGGGSARISVPATYGSKWLIPRLPEFAREHPDVNVILTTRIGPLDPSLDNLDAAVIFSEREPATSRSRLLMPLVLVPVCARSLLAPGTDPEKSLLKLPLLHQSTLPEAWPRFFAQLGLPTTRARRGQRYELFAMGTQAAVAGLGIALLPGFAMEEALRSRQLARVGRRSYKSPGGYWFVVPAGRPMTAPVARFRSWLGGTSTTGV